MKKIKGSFKRILCVLLVLIMIVGIVPLFGCNISKNAQEIGDLGSLKSLYLDPNDELKESYPNGAMMLPINTSDLDMQKVYAVHVFRQGDTKGDATITLKTIDLTAEYGNDYRLYSSDSIYATPVSGTANPYYAMQDITYIPVVGDREVEYLSAEKDDIQGQLELQNTVSEVNDINNELMPISTELKIDFKDGENDKTVYVETLKSDKVTDDKQFMITLSNPENCKIGTDVAATYTIKETREKPDSFIQIVDTKVNPDTDTAYVRVQRTGNCGTITDFYVNTISGSAKAEEAYEAVAMSLTFNYGITELAIPVNMLNAKDGTEFSLELSDVRNAIVTKETATVKIDKDAEDEDELASTGANTDLATTGDLLTKSTTQRDRIYIDPNCFKYSNKIGSWGEVNNKGNGKLYIGLNHGMRASEHTVSAVSNDTIDFTGVKTLRTCNDHKTGSCKWDELYVVIAKDDPTKDNNASCSWGNNLSGYGMKWDMTNVSSDHRIEQFDIDHSKVTGTDNNIYFVLQKGSFWGGAYTEFHSDFIDSSGNSCMLILQDYKISIINPPTVDLYVDGEMKSVAVANNSEMVDPGATSSSSTNRKTEMIIYRDETTPIISAIDSKYSGLVNLSGFYFCSDSLGSKHSELITLNNSSFTLTSEYLNNYSEYIKDNKIIIQPVYTVDEAKINVESYSDKTTGIRIQADNSNCTATAYKGDTKIADISWTKSSREGGKYLVGDSIKFDYAPEETYSTTKYQIAYDTRSARTEQLLDQSTIVSYQNGEKTISLTADNLYYSVTPRIVAKDCETKLHIINPENGSYSGKDGKYETINSDGSRYVTGYLGTNNSYYVFSDSEISSIVELRANPNSGYRAVWTYTDSATHKEVKYYGTEFFYAVQNPYDDKDNYINLTFEKVDSSNKSTQYISGTTQIQRGSIKHPPTEDDAIYEVSPNTTVRMDQYNTISDGQGDFTLYVDPNAQEKKTAAITVYGKEMHRALCYVNNQNFICDFEIDPANSTDNNSVSVDLKLPYKTYGVVPTSITARDSDGVEYNDSIMLVKTKSVQFDLYFSRTGEDPKYPVNLVKWTIVKADGSIGQTQEVEIKTTDSSAHYADVISEIAHAGDSLYVELYNKSYNSAAESQYKNYGRFNTGYEFVATSVEEQITYMPNLGLPSTASNYQVLETTDSNGETKYVTTGDDRPETIAKPIPCIGPISPMISLFGFTPIFSTGSTGEKDKDGHDMYSVSIGITFGALKNMMAEDPKWGTKGPMDQAKGLLKKLDDLDKINNSEGGFKAFGGGKALNLQTAINVSFSFTFCFQGNYYKDKDTGEWRFTNTLFIAGAGGSISVSIPFVLLYIPCFVNFKFSADITAFIGTFPSEKAKEGKESVYLTLKELSDESMNTLQGVLDLKFNFTIGLGVGYDGLLSASGHLINNFDLQFVDYGRGVGLYDLKGGVTLQLLFISSTWDGNIVSATLFDTLNEEENIAETMASALNSENILRNVTIGDMSVEDNPTYDDAVALTGTSSPKNEKVLIQSSTMDTPQILPLGDDKYFIATVLNEDDDFRQRIHYLIYDAKTGTPTDQKAIVDQLKDDLFVDGQTCDVDFLKIADNLSDDVTLTDAGDDIIISWLQCTTNSTDNIELIDSVRNAVVFYNKSTGKFHDLSLVPKKNDGNLCFENKIIYNAENNTAQIFSETIDFSNVTNETTLEELQESPISLVTSTLDLNTSKTSWNDPEIVIKEEKNISYFDAMASGDKNILVYVSTNNSGLTLEDMGDAEYNSNYVSADDFNTENAMYYRNYTLKDGKMTASESIQITDESYVVAHPQLIRVNTQGVDNSLLFYKSNGRLAYTNLDNVLSQGIYVDNKGNKKVIEEYMEPNFITDEEDHSINDDFVIEYNEDGDIYALWTVSEGEQQQIWGMHFYIDKLTTLTETTVLDSYGQVKYDSNGNPQMQELEKPIKLLSGYWGGKAKLTNGGVLGSEEHGLFKQHFDADILDNGDIIAVYNTFDYLFNEDTQKWENANNNFVIAEYDPRAIYKTVDSDDTIQFSTMYPNVGENVTITMKVQNDGLKTGRDVDLNLYVNDTLYDTKKIDPFLASDTQTVTMNYILEEGIKAEDVRIHYEVVDDGQVMCTSYDYEFYGGTRIVMDSATITPIQYIYGDETDAKFLLSVDVWNTGNESYSGGDIIDFVDSDINAQTAMLDDDIDCSDPCYTVYGQTTVPELAIGEKKTITFVSEEIPSTVFSRRGADAANLEFLLLASEDKELMKLYEDDEVTMKNILNIGQTQTPRPAEVKTLTVEPIKVFVGASQMAQYTVTPLEAAVFWTPSFESADETIATVDENGYIIGVKKGETTISITVGDKTDVINVTVENPYGDVDGDGYVSVIDATKIQQYLAGVIIANDIDLEKADVDGDGKVTITDSTYIQMLLVTKLSVFPIYKK